MNLKVSCKNLKGNIVVPCSKSLAHRYLLASFLAGEIEKVKDFDAYCDDIATTKECLLKLYDNSDIINCHESGTTFRLLMAVIPALGMNVEIHIDESLAKRPISDLVDELNKHGAEIIKTSNTTYKISGKLKPGKYEIPGNISSQYISALLFALPLLDGESELQITEEIESKPYIDLTLQFLKFWHKRDGSFYTTLGTKRTGPNAPKLYTKMAQKEPSPLEGDWSLGAMWLVASKLLGNTINVEGLNEESNQADAMIQDLLEIDDDLDVIVSIQDCPDLAPAIALWAINRDADTTITDVSRLKLKESNRLDAIVSVLTELGANIKSKEDCIVIMGTNHHDLPGSDKMINTYNDHRIVMLASLFSIITEKAVNIGSPESVNKSYPNFFKEIEKLGGKIEWNYALIESK